MWADDAKFRVLLLVGDHGDGADQVGAEDGILSAAEVLGLDLSGTELVVLSGCETALGNVSHGQGVHGLSHAFRLAGAHAVLCALWSVPDAITASFMERFYGTSTIDIPRRLREHAILQIDEARAAGRFPDPYYWAPFITIGDWETTIVTDN